MNLFSYDQPPTRWLSRRSASAQLFDALNHILLTLLALACLVPFWHILVVSLSASSAANAGHVILWPVRFTLRTYQNVLQGRAFITAFWITVQRTALGTILNMALTVLMAYPLSKTAQEFKGRNVFLWLLVFAMLFDGGLIPWFLVIRKLGLINTIWALVLPGALPLWNVILLMNFFREVPRELDEAALMDGAGHLRRLEELYLPLSSGALATLALFAAVNHWNSWFDGMVLMWDVAKQPLQTYVRATLAPGQRVEDAARIILSTLPILVVYPFLQRYFVAGIRLGAVKG